MHDAVSLAVRIKRRARAGIWRGPVPPRRVSPPPVLGQFIHLAFGRSVPAASGRPAPEDPSLPLDRAASAEFQFDETVVHDSSESHKLSWAGLGRKLRFLWTDQEPTDEASRAATTTIPAIQSSPVFTYASPPTARVSDHAAGLRRLAKSVYGTRAYVAGPRLFTAGFRFLTVPALFAASVLLPLCLAPGWTEVLGRTGRWRGFLLGVRHRVLRCRRGSSTLMPSHSQRRGHMYPWAGTDIFQWVFKLRKKILMQDLKEKKLLILRSRFNSRSLLFWC
jgi:hypothetical protein